MIRATCVLPANLPNIVLTKGVKNEKIHAFFCIFSEKITKIC